MTQQLSNTSSVPQAQKHQNDYILLDASSSMSDKWWQSLEAIDNYVSGLKAQNVNSNIILATFTTSQGFRYDRCRETTVDAWTPLVNQSPDFWAGTTPLYDAINQMANEVRDLRPGSIMIVTDGEENGSQTNLVQAKSFLDWLRAKGWQITFFGCEFENSQQARQLGLGPQNAIGTSAKRLTDAAAALARKRANHAHFGTPMNFSEDEQQRFAGYLGSSNGY
jgi:hypothetical protein